MQSAICTFLAALSIAHSESHKLMLESEALVPSLIIFLMRLSSRLFEEDPELVESSSLASLYVRCRLVLLTC
jgi:hypothetical protein